MKIQYNNTGHNFIYFSHVYQHRGRDYDFVCVVDLGLNNFSINIEQMLDYLFIMEQKNGKQLAGIEVILDDRTGTWKHVQFGTTMTGSVNPVSIRVSDTEEADFKRAIQSIFI